MTDLIGSKLDKLLVKVHDVLRGPTIKETKGAEIQKILAKSPLMDYSAQLYSN